MVVSRAPWSQVFVVSAIVMGISYTIAKEKIFEPLRARLGGRDTWLGYLVCCPYCNSFWIAFALVPLTGTYVIDLVWPVGWLGAIARWFLSCIFVVVCAAFLRIAFYFLDESQGLLRREITKTELDTKLEATMVAREADLEQPEQPSIPH